MSRPESEAEPAILSHTSRPQPQKPRSLSPSNVSLFVANLRLLNLDRRQDWPDITVRTFDTKDALQNQKKRVSSVEWSLYRLFEIWDRETTRDKLQPFFPPLEPIQSLNLRAALFRCLNDLKKNDVLGREATLRKTMLDDCKGDKFEEILLLFSTAVVRKQVLAIRRKQHFSVGKNLAVAKTLDKRELSTLGPLSLAYLASLSKTLRTRTTLDQTIGAFRTSLYEKTNEFHQRHLTLLEARDAKREALPPEVESSIRRELRQNWVGGIEGCDALLGGAKTASLDACMDSSFEKLWNHFQQGTTPQVPYESTSLLENLQTRVAEQNDRLRMWRAYKDVFEESNGPASPTQTANSFSPREVMVVAPGLDIFDRHRSIRVEGVSSEPMDFSTSEYDHVVQDMKQSLAEVGKKKRTQHTASSHQPVPITTRRKNDMQKQTSVPVFLAGSREPQQDFFSPLKRPLLSSVNSTPVEPRQAHPFSLRTYTQPAGTPPSARSVYGSVSDYHFSSHQHGAILRQSGFNESVPGAQQPQDQYLMTPVPAARSELESTPSGTTALGLAFEPPQNDDYFDQLAEEINHIDLEQQHIPPPSDLPVFSPPASSSPPAPVYNQQSPQSRPNLSERTRMSMSSFRSSENSQPLPIPTPDALDTDALVHSRRTSLADHTLSSTSTTHTLPLRRTTKDRPHSSFFPATASSTHYSTPIKPSRTSLAGTRDTTPRDKLFDQDAEYASVFKSRPKIAMSPVLSPQGDGDGDGYADEAEEFSFEGEEEMGLRSSPLAKFGL